MSDEAGEQNGDIVLDIDDFLLEIVINLVEGSRGQYEQPMTFNVGGVLVSGHLVSGSQYLKEVQGGALRDAVIRALKTLDAEDSTAADRPGGEPEPLPITHIHLRNARFYSGGQETPRGGEGVLWRGRLSSIDGYVFGELQAVREDE